jgi:sodium/proline symporter
MITKIIVLGIYVAILFLIGIIASRRVKSIVIIIWAEKRWAFGLLHFLPEQPENLDGF